jgi:diguanylate cyclase (GGDEF)-like protein/PAS domain S-box-containing protein
MSQREAQGMSTQHSSDSASAEIRVPLDLTALQVAALEAAANAVVITDQRGDIIWVNPAFERLTGYSRAESVGRNTRFLKSDQTPEALYAELWRTILAGRIWHGEIVNRRKDGTLYTEEMTITPVRDGHGETTHYVAIKQDITEGKKTEEQMCKMEESLRTVGRMSDLLHSCHTLEEASGVISSAAQRLFPGLSGAVFFLSQSRNLLEPAACWGWSSLLERVFSPDDCWALRRGRLHHWRKDDVTVRCPHCEMDGCLASLCLPLIAQGETLGIVCLVADVYEDLAAPETISKPNTQLASTMTEQAATSLANIKLRERLRVQATRDPLTGLFNRRYLDEFLERELSNAIRKNRSLGVIMLDIDQFKEFNDRFGHDAGDAVLRELGDYLMKFIRRGDLACRYGGEEFVLVLPDALLEDTRRRAEELRTSVRRLSIRMGSVELREITVSLGVAAYPEQGAAGFELLRAADSALRQAKEEGRDRVLVAQALAPASMQAIHSDHPPC